MKRQQTSRPAYGLEEKQKGLPVDLPSLEALWKMEVKRLLKPIKAKAMRVERKAQDMLDRQSRRMRKHEEGKPREPTGLLIRKGGYQKRLNTWSKTLERLRHRQLQLCERVDWLREYSRDRVSSIYKSPAEQLAERRLVEDQPEFARKLVEARETQYNDEIEKIRQSLQQRNDRGRSNQRRRL